MDKSSSAPAPSRNPACSFGARAWLCALCLAALVPAAFATEITLAPSPSVACLTLTPGTTDMPQYPLDLLLRKSGGKVPVELTFRGPDQEPLVKVLDELAGVEMIGAVKDHVSRLRVPCMGVNDAAVTLRQDYVFDPISHGKVMASQIQDPAYAQRRSQLGCLTHTTPGAVPRYPMFSARLQEQGNYLVELHFFAPDQAPEVKWLAESRSLSLKYAIQEHLKGLRLPCLDGGPLDGIQVYSFVFSGGERTVLTDMTLTTLMAQSRSLPKPAYFDLSGMACPFELRVEYYRPYASNRIRELDTSFPARLPFIDWLKNATLNLEPRDNIDVLGQPFVLTVPCGKVDI